MSVNKVILVGNVGKDPEVRYLDNGIVVATITLATSERAYTTKGGVQVPEKTEWHNIIAWRGLAGIAEKYIKKGSQLYIEGRLSTKKWEKDGVVRYTTQIVADNIELLGKKPEGGYDPSRVSPDVKDWAEKDSRNNQEQNSDVFNSSESPHDFSGNSDDLPF